jgi:hypothetical protein
MNGDRPMDPESPSTRPELPPPIPLYQIAYFGDEDGRSALTLEGPAVLCVPTS